MPLVNCPVCDWSANEIAENTGDRLHYLCKRCGDFEVTGTVRRALRDVSDDARPKVSGWLRQKTREQVVAVLTGDMLRLVVNGPLPTVLERADLLLKEIAHDQRRIGAEFDISDARFISASYSDDDAELNFFTRMLEGAGLIEQTDDDNSRITPAGYVRLDEMRQKPQPTNKAFVAMSFDTELRSIFDEGIAPGAREAGYDAVRVDNTDHVNRIDDEIIGLINQSAFVIADFTQQKGGVYYEAGYAQGRRMPVIWTCRHDDLQNLHFDTRQYNFIAWNNTAELAGRLTKRIRAVIG